MDIIDWREESDIFEGMTYFFFLMSGAFERDLNLNELNENYMDAIFDEQFGMTVNLTISQSISK